MNLNKIRTRPLILVAALFSAVVLPGLGLARAAGTFSEEPTSGSIQVSKDEGGSNLAKLAKVSMSQAEQAATRYTGEKVIEAELENENGFLVWEVKSLAQDGTLTDVYIDAGNGKVLAMEQEDEGDRGNYHQDEEQEGEGG
ncbi:MAG: PepSY domain-containing protein [Pseudomonadota bacterium]|nr:PepSY domain-containing protein [Pseudomonadota bacterium]